MTGPAAAAAAGATRFDWGLGRYEPTAAQLEPASRVVVERADPKASERVLDLGCGTGNAALLAAARGATVTAVDPASRLLDVARARAAAQRAEITFALGEAASLPTGSGSVDVLLSVFAVVFAPDPVAAAAEMARVTAPQGRIVLSAWLPTGTIREVVSMARDAEMAALDAPPAPTPFDWHDRESLRRLLGPHGFRVDVDVHTHVFTAASIDEYLQRELIDHPLWVAARARLEARGRGDVQAEVVDRAREILAAGNEDPGGFAATSSYVVVIAKRA